MKLINEFTIHNKYGDYMGYKYRSLNKAIEECNKQSYESIVFQIYFDVSSWRPWDKRLIAHGKEVYRNY